MIYSVCMSEEITKKIKALKPSVGFSVELNERVRVLQIAAIMKRAGLIKFDVVTKRCGDSFKVIAV